MSDAPDIAPKKRRWALLVSVCLNFFLAGLVVTGLFVAWQRAALGPPGPSSLPFHPRNIAAMLPEEGREKVEAISARHRTDFFGLMREVRRARFRAFRIFKADPFDAEAFAKAMDEVRAADAAVAAAGQNVILEIAKELTPEERATVVEKIRSRRWGRDGDDFGRDDDDDDHDRHGPPGPPPH